MISFEHPGYLWGLSGVAIAIAIHLLSKKPARILFAGSVRHLQPAPSSQFRSVRLNEIALLLLRILMLILFCFSIARPFMYLDAGRARWVLLEKGLENNGTVTKIVDSLIASGYERRYLQTGFPKTTKENAIAPPPSYWTLSSSLEEQSLDDAIIFYQQRAEAFRGQRRAMPARQRWVPVTIDSTATFPLTAITTGDSVQIRIGRTNPQETSFENIMRPANGKYTMIGKDSIMVSPDGTIRVHIHSDKGFENDDRILSSAFHSLETESKIKFERVADADTAAADWAIWLSDKPFNYRTQIPCLVFRENQSEPLLIQVAPQQWLLGRHLSIADAVSQNFALALGKIMLPEKRYGDVIARNDRRTSQRNAWASAISKQQKLQNRTGRKESVIPILLAVLLIVLIGERMLAQKRNQ